MYIGRLLLVVSLSASKLAGNFAIVFTPNLLPDPRIADYCDKKALKSLFLALFKEGSSHFLSACTFSEKSSDNQIRVPSDCPAGHRFL